MHHLRSVKKRFKRTIQISKKENKEFTGISDPYEKPKNPEITINSDGEM